MNVGFKIVDKSAVTDVVYLPLCVATVLGYSERIADTKVWAIYPIEIPVIGGSFVVNTIQKIGKTMFCQGMLNGRFRRDFDIQDLEWNVEIPIPSDDRISE